MKPVLLPIWITLHCDEGHRARTCLHARGERRLPLAPGRRLVLLVAPRRLLVILGVPRGGALVRAAGPAPRPAFPGRASAPRALVPPLVPHALVAAPGGAWGRGLVGVEGGLTRDRKQFKINEGTLTPPRLIRITFAQDLQTI